MSPEPLHAGHKFTGPLAEMATIYHTDQWLQLLSNYFGYQPAPHLLTDLGRPVGLAALVETKSLRGKALRSPPASMYGHLIAESDQILNDLVASLTQRAEDPDRRLLITVATNNAHGLSVVRNEMDTRVPTHPPDILWTLVDSSVRRALRKAQKSQINVRAGDYEDLRNFFRLLVMTRKRLRLPVTPFNWLRNILQSGFAGLLIAEHDKTPVAGILYLADTYHIHYALPAYSESGAKLHAMDACLWELLKRAHKSGRQWVCLGGSPLSNHGLRRFKRKWGGEERPMTFLSNRPLRHWGLERRAATSSLVPYLPSVVLQGLGYFYLSYLQ